MRSVLQQRDAAENSHHICGPGCREVDVHRAMVSAFQVDGLATCGVVVAGVERWPLHQEAAQEP